MSGIDSYASLVLHFNTSFIDSSLYNCHVRAGSSNTTINSSNPVFGAGSAKLVYPVSGYCIIVPSGVNFNFGTANFTIELFFRGIPAGSDNINIYYQDTDSNNYLNLWTNFLGQTGFTVRSGGSTVVDVNCNVNVLNSTWNHIAVVRNGTSAGCLAIYINGISQTLTLGTDLSSNSMPALTSAIQMGVDNVSTSTLYFDEVRISKGIARYTSNFTVPIVEFSDILSVTGILSATSELAVFSSNENFDVTAVLTCESLPYLFNASSISGCTGVLSCIEVMSNIDITGFPLSLGSLNLTSGISTCSIKAIQDTLGEMYLVSELQSLIGDGAIGCLGDLVLVSEPSILSSFGVVGSNGVIKLISFDNELISSGLVENLGSINDLFGVGSYLAKGLVDNSGVIGLESEDWVGVFTGTVNVIGTITCSSVIDIYNSSGAVGSTGVVSCIELMLKFNSSGLNGSVNEFEAFCLNLFKKGLVSNFTNYIFNSFAEINGVLFGAKSTGMYSLTGNLDDTVKINSRIVWPLKTLGTTNVKQVRAVKYFGRLGDTVGVTVTDGSNNSWETDFVNAKGDMNAVEVPGYFPFTARGRYLQFELDNANGCDFLIDRIELALYVLGRM